MEINLNALVTEQRNPRTEHIDEVPTEELCRLINQEDQTVPIAVEKELPQIAKAIDVIAAQIEVGGRLFLLRRRHLRPSWRIGCKRMPAYIRRRSGIGCRTDRRRDGSSFLRKRRSRRLRYAV